MLLWSVLAISVVIAVFSAIAAGAVWVLPVAFLGSFLTLAALAFGFLWLMCVLVRQDVPQEKDSPFYRRMAHLYIDSVVRILRVTVHKKGLERTPKDGRFLLVCNHLSNADPVLLLDNFRHSQLAFITKRENCSMFIVGPLMHKILCQPINRENDREALKTILTCIRLLKEDMASIAVFPEGYCSADGKLRRFRSGVFKIALKTNVPIVVCTLKNTIEALDDALKGKPSQVWLNLVDVIQPEQYAGMTTVQLADMVYQMMAKDLGPELVYTEQNT